MADDSSNPTDSGNEPSAGKSAAAAPAAAPTAPARPAASPKPAARPDTDDDPVDTSSGKAGLLKRMNPFTMFRKETPANLVKAAKDMESMRSFAQATVLYKKALEMDADYAAAYIGLGDLSVKKGGRGNVEASLPHYQEAIRRNPFNEAVYGSIARVYDMLGKRKEAALEKKKMVVVRTLQADPGNPAANNNMGILFLQQGHATSALDYFNRAVKSDPRYETSLRNLAVVYYQKAKEATEPPKLAAHLETANEFIRRALEVSESPLTLLAYARILIMEEKHEEALAACEQVEKSDPAMKEMFGLKQIALMKLNRLEEANKAYETYRFLSAHE